MPAMPSRAGMCLAVVIALALASATPTRAQPLGVDLPKGESVVDIAWFSATSVVFLVETKEGYALRRLEVATGELSVIGVPRSFSNLHKTGAGAAGPVFSMAPAGNALAILEQASDPLTRPELSVYRCDGTELKAVSVHQVPSDFWTAQMTWDNRGQELFLVAQPYLFPDQRYSIGKLSLQGESFSGVALKDNVDLVSEVASIPQRGALAVRCGGFQGQYPGEEVIALLDPAHPQGRVLNARAKGLAMKALASGELLVYHTGEPGSRGAAGDTLCWLLGPHDDALRLARLALGDAGASLEQSADGTWMGFLSDGSKLGVKGAGGKLLLGLQRASDGKMMVSNIPTAAFEFSPFGGFVCAVGDGGARVYFYQLPD